jgi:TonB family protein
MFNLLVAIWIKSAAILTVAWLGTWLLRNRSAAARHLVWTAAAAAILALPLLSVALPSWHVAPAAIDASNVGLVFRVFATAASGGANLAAGATADLTTRVGQTARVLPDWRIMATAVWALGCVLMLLNLLVAFLRMARLRARSPQFAESDLPVLTASLAMQDKVQLLQGPEASMPMAVGLARPAIFLPSDAIHWTAERRRMVLLHELAHVHRGDVATHLIARAALILNWWNPLAWTAWRAFLKESERAADDLVLAAGARPSEYAGHLLEVARSMQSPRGAAWAALAMARRAELEGRLLAILDSRARRRSIGRLTPFFAAIAAAALIAPFAAIRAQDQSAQAIPPELDATIRAANAQKNHEILEHAASAYENLRKYDVAQTLLEQALSIRGQVSGEQSAAYAAGLVKLGDLEMQRNKRADALNFYRKAVALGDRPEVAGALVELGIAALGNRNLVQSAVNRMTGESAQDYFQRAINADPNGPKAGTAYTWLAEMKRSEPGEAESLYQKALSAEAPNSAEAANTMHLYARFLQQHDRAVEGEEMERQARAINAAAATHYAKQIGSGGIGRAAATGALKVGGGVSAPMLISKTEPEYTEQARAAKYQGTVLLYIEVGPDGYAHNINVIRGLGLGLDEKAIEAVSQWQFKPGQKEGQPVTVQATIEVNFRLL